jgi:hypothetical protein
MKRFIVAALALACIFSSPVFAQGNPSDVANYDKPPVVTNTQTNTTTPTAPTSVTTVVKGGSFAADVLEWLKVIFVPIVGGLLVGIAFKVMSFFGVKVEDSNRAQLQSIIVNGLNQAAAKAEGQLRANPKLDIDVKSQVISDAIAYTQEHGKDTIKALGLDATDQKAVEAIRARIQTAIIDPLTPTNPALAKVIAPKVV